MKSEPALFNGGHIWNHNSIPLRTSKQNGGKANLHVHHRSLFLFGSATGSICSLTPGKFYFEEDPNTGLYYWNSEKNEEEFKDVYSAYNFTGLTKWNETNITTTTRTITARACLCTLYVERPVEFCSSEFLSCNVRSTPVTCFTLSSTDTFIQSFWPVLMFWILVVVYSLYFTEAGKAARQYCRRMYGKVMQRTWGASNHLDSSDSDRMVERTLDHMLEYNPSRVSNIYRERIFRQRRRLRYELRREQLCWYKSWKQLRSFFVTRICCGCKTATSLEQTGHGTTGNNVGVENFDAVEAGPDMSALDNNSFPRITAPSAHRLALKTKVYHEPSVSSTVISHIETCPSVDPVTKSTAIASTSWSLSSVLAPFHRAAENESLATDDLDDEVEHGIRCAICLIRLRDGIDIVGDIPCNHFMHKQCLKEWLARKNRCPLCQLSDIAHRQQSGVVDLSSELDSHLNSGQHVGTDPLDESTEISNPR